MPNIFLPISPVVPNSLVITAITNANPAIITVAASNNYVVGQLILLTVPSTYGMTQANGLTVQITAINGLNFTVNLDTTRFDAFVVPAVGKEAPASLSPAGIRNSYNNLNVPFHSLGNTGN